MIQHEGHFEQSYSTKTKSLDFWRHLIAGQHYHKNADIYHLPPGHECPIESSGELRQKGRKPGEGKMEFLCGTTQVLISAAGHAAIWLAL